jgi:two-component system, OmpR family, KDP operon response regulator KdpE
MKVLLVKLPEDVSKYIPLVLKVRWPDLSLLRTEEAVEALQLVHSDQPNLALLHMPLPGEGSSCEECFDLVGEIRAFSAIPLIVISKGGDSTDRVRALETGADDWISPSASPMEFIARVNALMRRCYPEKLGLSCIHEGKLTIDYQSRRVSVFGRTVDLTPLQFRMLSYLAQNQGRVCSNAELLRHVWGPNTADDRELLKLNVYRLRSKIERDPSNPEFIFNERGVGYVIRASSSDE